MTRRPYSRPHAITNAHRARRLAWQVVWTLAYRLSPTPMHGWRRALLRWFGASIDRGAHPYPRARIWAPWNLHMGVDSCIADDVDCYCVDRISLGDHATVSQYSYLCTAGHDVDDVTLPLIAAPIEIEADAWVAADVFVGPGVTVGRGAVVGARSTVTSDVAAWTIVGGSPVRFIRLREPFLRSPPTR